MHGRAEDQYPLRPALDLATGLANVTPHFKPTDPINEISESRSLSSSGGRPAFSWLRACGFAERVTVLGSTPGITPLLPPGQKFIISCDSYR